MSETNFVSHQELELYVGQLTDHILSVEARLSNRIEALRSEMNDRFEKVDLRLDRLERGQEKILDILGSIQEQLKR